MAFNWFKKSKKNKNIPETDETDDKQIALDSDSDDIVDDEVSDNAILGQDDKSIVESELSETDSKKKPKGLFSRLKNGLAKTREVLSTDINDLFTIKKKVDDDLLEELEEILITSDIGVQTTMKLIEKISKQKASISNAMQLKDELKKEILSILNVNETEQEVVSCKPKVIMVIGVNGVGKTTTIGKMAAKSVLSEEKVIIAAADTFRAAAVEQLSIWSERAGAEIIRHKDGSDPAAVAFDAVEAAVARKADVVFIDTAGRLHTKVNLMEELKKIKRAISKKIPEAPHEILLVLDATTGQNGLAQAKLFNDELNITGIAVTKLDGTAKAGIIISICDTMKIPIKYIGVGEKINDLQKFNPSDFVNALF